MFTIYKKIISPDTSPVLGPAKSESPDLKPVQEVTQGVIHNEETLSKHLPKYRD